MELLTAIKNLTAAIRARNFGDILKYAGEIMLLGSSLFGPVKAGSVACADADLDAAVGEFNAAATSFDTSVTFEAAPDKANLDPATILLLIQAVSAIIGFFWKK